MFSHQPSVSFVELKSSNIKIPAYRQAGKYQMNAKILKRDSETSSE